jgi:phage-related protein (TIGR01555 family)
MTTTHDGFANFVTNLGTTNPAGQGRYVPRLYGQQELDVAYDTSTWFGKIIDIRAGDATREWRSWKADQGEIEDLEGLEKRLGVQSKINQALKWADLYGGAVIIPDLPGNSASPLRPDSVNGWNMRFLTVLHRWQISPQGQIRNPLDPNYGKPEKWQVPVQDGVQLNFHPSRVILVNGRSHGHQTDIWGKSLWEHMADAVLAADGAAAVISALLKEAKIDVIGVDSLMDGLGTDKYEADLLKRWQLVAQLKSIANVTLIDKADEWNTKTINWSGLPDVIEQLLTIMAGAADIPVTRLIGTSAKGLNATGDGDLRNYYDGIKAKQDLSVSPQLAPLDDMLIRSALGDRPDNVWYDWKPLWQPDEKTKWETEKLRTDTFAAALGTAAIDEEVLTKTYLNGSVETGLYPGIEQAIADAGNEGISDLPDPADLEVPVLADAAPRTLYVSRKLLNGAALVKWAKSVGIVEPLAASDMHVTITYSRNPVDWLKMGNSWEEELTIPKGGARLLERFDGGAVVLAFASNMLKWRNEEMREQGASFDYDEYQPHVTLTYAGEGLDLSAIQAYQGELRFGPEVFAEVNEDWKE